MYSMDETTQNSIFWSPSLTHDEIGFFLDVPNWVERTERVDQAWRAFIAQRRSHVAHWALSTPADKNVLEEWEYWQWDEDDVRFNHYDEPVIALAEDKRAFAQDYAALPTRFIDYDVGQFRVVPQLLELIGGEPTLHLARSHADLIEIHDRIDAHYRAAIGINCWNILVHDLPEDRSFERIVRHDFVHLSAQQVVAAVDSQDGYQSRLPLLDEARIAAGFTRWLSFWRDTKCQMHAYSPSVLNYRL
jgi:hypothetical protein